MLALLLLPRHGGGAGGAGGNGRSIGRSVVGTRSRSSLHTRGAHVKLCYARRRRRWRTYRVTHHMTFTVRRGVSRRRRRRRIPCCRLYTYRGCLLCTIRFSDKSKTLIFMRFILQHYDTKGQIISKANYGILNSSKKRTNKFNFTTMIPQDDLFSFVFWRKLKTPKRLFEIN